MDRALVFDMGGVLYEFRGDQLIAETSRRKRRWRREEVQRRWVPLVHDFETGRRSEAQFASDVVRGFDLVLSEAEFVGRFREAANGFYESALELVRELRAAHHLLSLSNTNAVQWPKVLEDLGAEDPFHAHHPSHVSGFHKPDPRAYQRLQASLPAGTACYFFDDRADNVSAARACGWTARRVRGPAEARRACVELGLLERAPEHARHHVQPLVRASDGAEHLHAPIHLEAVDAEAGQE